MAGTFELRKEEWKDEFGQPLPEIRVFPTKHWMPQAPDRLVPNPDRLGQVTTQVFPVCGLGLKTSLACGADLIRAAAITEKERF